MMKKVSGMQSASPSLKIQLAKETPSIIDLQSTGKTKERTVTSATVNKWKFELAEKGISEWLPFSADKDGKAQNLKCKVCTMYEYEKFAYKLYLKSKGVAIDERAHKLSLSNTNIVAGITKMDKNDEERTKQKFGVAY